VQTIARGPCSFSDRSLHSPRPRARPKTQRDPAKQASLSSARR